MRLPGRPLLAALVVMGPITTFLRRGWSHHDLQVIVGQGGRDDHGDLAVLMTRFPMIMTRCRGPPPAGLSRVPRRWRYLSLLPPASCCTLVACPGRARGLHGRDNDAHRVRAGWVLSR